MTEPQAKKSYELTQSISSPAVGRSVQDKSSTATAGKNSGLNETGGFTSSISSSNTESSLSNPKSSFAPLNPTPPHLTSKPPLSPPPSQLSPRLQPKVMKVNKSVFQLCMI